MVYKKIQIRVWIFLAFQMIILLLLVLLKLLHFLGISCADYVSFTFVIAYFIASYSLFPSFFISQINRRVSSSLNHGRELIFCSITGFNLGGISASCLLYRLWKNIPLAKRLNSNTCSIVNSVNFKLICVEVLSWEKLKLVFLRMNLKCSVILWKNVCILLGYR